MANEASQRPLSTDITIGLAAGLAATQVANLAQGPLKWMTPDHVHRHEDSVRPGTSSSLVAAQKIARVLDFSPSERDEEVWGKAIHFGFGMSWGPVYGLLRRYGGLNPAAAALVSGSAMSLVLDEGLVPALGLSAPNHHYHAITRVRGFVAHLVYGVSAAIVAEGLGYCASVIGVTKLKGDADQQTRGLGNI